MGLTIREGDRQSVENQRGKNLKGRGGTHVYIVERPRKTEKKSTIVDPSGREMKLANREYPGKCG